ncbi:MAG: enhanced serine sensitivity protein SseB C-terminal domain-containing protein [Xanthomonadales bacterium]|nr:enhanced serine sensitivity protein SseB C-terminal domain-containing protein [Xanthomonadales bacterium]
MPNELERLLDLACREPGYAPDFYRCVLASEIYALIPTVGHGMDEGKLRFVMWRGADGHDVIPYFTSEAAVTRAIKPGWQAIKLRGQKLFEATRGATVVLNPNESASCRLSPGEVALLLDTGAISSPERETSTGDRVRAFHAVATPPTATLQSLSILFSRHPSVHRAYLAYCFPPDDPDACCYLIVVRMDDRDTERLVRESAQVMQDVPPDLGMDLITCFDDASDLLRLFATFGPPFYDQGWGSRIVAPESARPI